jgi:hypothetical protein
LSELSKKILSTLMVSGAQSPEKAMPLAELASKLQVPADTIAVEVDDLAGGSYAVVTDVDGVACVYLTGTGVITASSTYS